MSTQKPKPTPETTSNQTERVGLWVGLGVAAVAAVGVLALAFYTDYTEKNKTEIVAASETSEHQQPEIVSSIPISEAQAASLAAAATEKQINGMDAPAEDDDSINASEVVVVTSTTVIEPQPITASHTAASQPLAASHTAAPTIQSASTAASSPAQAILANETVAEQTQVVAENGKVQFTFATGKSDVAANTLQALNGVVEGVKEGKKAVILSYAGIESNERLAKERAFAVRSVLLAAGVPESHIEVKEPTTVANDSRRVEVVLQ